MTTIPIKINREITKNEFVVDKDLALNASALDQSLNEATQRIHKYVSKAPGIMETTAALVKCQNQDDRDLALAYAANLRAEKLAIEEHYKPYTDAFNKAHKRVTSERAELLKPIESEVARLKEIATPPAEEAKENEKELAWACENDLASTVVMIAHEIVRAGNAKQVSIMQNLISCLILNHSTIDAALRRDGIHLQIPGITVVERTKRPRVIAKAI